MARGTPAGASRGAYQRRSLRLEPPSRVPRTDGGTETGARLEQGQFREREMVRVGVLIGAVISQIGLGTFPPREALVAPRLARAKGQED